MKYVTQIVKTVTKLVVIEADRIEDCEVIAKEMYEGGRIDMTDNCKVDVDFITMREYR